MRYDLNFSKIFSGLILALVGAYIILSGSTRPQSIWLSGFALGAGVTIINLEIINHVK